jgi:prepilin-type N-terminal cleavage/methylation domain-containing protein
MVEKKDRKNGFTLIEVMIAMAIFGFLAYVITAILISVISTVVQINQRAYLRGDIESMISSITQDAQFATQPTLTGPSCVGYTTNTCITFTVPSDTGAGTAPVQKIETYYLDLTLHKVVKIVNINGSSTTYYMNPTNVNVTSVYFDIQGDNIFFSTQAEVDSSKGSKIVGISLAANIQYNKQ